MSFNHMLEVASTQRSVEAMADAIAIEVDKHRLQSNTEILSAKSFKIGIVNANSEEVASLVASFLDTASDVGLQVVESACGKCAVVIFDDADSTELASLSEKHIIEIAASDDDDDPMGDDSEDDPHEAEDDEDVDLDDEDEEDEDVKDDPNKMKILATDEGFKIAQRLHALSCGNDRSEFPHFLTSLDTLLQGFRNRSGYDPNANQETASLYDGSDTLEVALGLFDAASTLFFEETAKKKKKKMKTGRAGFLSAYMKAVGKRGEELGDAWDALDTEAITKILADAGGVVLDQMEQERQNRGLDAPEPDSDEALPSSASSSEEKEEASSKTVNK